jgi:RHS repeat-associated protein
LNLEKNKSYYYLSEMILYNHYYPFGMPMPDRKSGSQSYRFSFQGQEKDDEIKGQGNSLNYEYRMHDPRIGRFFATDPLECYFAYNSPYAFSENRVIDGVEFEGLEVVPANEKWDMKETSTSATIDPENDVNWEGGFKAGWFGGEFLTLHEITAGANKGNWYAVSHGQSLSETAEGKTPGYIWFLNMKKGDTDHMNAHAPGQENYSYEEGTYIFGKDVVPDGASFTIDRTVSTGGLIWAVSSEYEYSSTLAYVQLVNVSLSSGPLKGFWDETGDFIDQTTSSDVLDYGVAMLKSPEYWIGMGTAGVLAFSPSRVGSLKPLGKGSTGRTTANNLTEKLAMDEIMSTPADGMILIHKMPDATGRWHGWSKMSNKTAHGVEIHYNALWENGNLKAIDDFKFIDP